MVEIEITRDESERVDLYLSADLGGGGCFRPSFAGIFGGCELIIFCCGFCGRGRVFDSSTVVITLSPGRWIGL